MSYKELMKSILNTSKHDWLYNDERGIFTLKNDLDVRIVSKEIDFDNDKFYGEDWAVSHPDPVAYKKTYEIYYRSSFVEEFTLVGVDGFRAYLPMPKVNTLFITPKQYSLAEAVDSLGTLDEYLGRAKLSVQDS